MKKFVSFFMVIAMLLSLGSLAFADSEEPNAEITQSSVDFIWPTSSRIIKSPYGWRIHPIEGTRKFHEGVDIERITNSDPVWAASDGIVVYSGFHTNSNGTPGYGNLVIINYNWQGKIIQTRYAHLA